MGAADGYLQDLDLKTSYDGRGLGMELSEVPRSRAPSYTSRQSYFNGDDDENPLLRPTASKHLSTITKETLTSDASRHDFRHSTTTISKEKKRRFQGWRFGVAVSALLAAFVFLVNFLFVTIASAKSVVEGGIGTMFDGDCHYVERATIWLHIAINILSSLLLSASNYTMQALCSPTRAETDKAHASGDWLDIGMPSVRNIWGRISKRRTVMWWILGLSSVPIHLLYNSAVFKTLDATLYQPLLVNSRFLDTEVVFKNSTIPSGVAYYPQYIRRKRDWFLEHRDELQTLSNADCISAYGTNFVSGFSDVLLMTESDDSADNQIVFWAAYDTSEYGSSYSWICTDTSPLLTNGERPCDVAKAKRDADQWTIKSMKIDHCLTRISPSHCKLQFSQAILITVLLMNAAKFAVMAWTYYFQKEVTLVTLGDAIASFLITPDDLTVSRCLMSKQDVAKGPLRWRLKAVSGEDTNATKRPNTQPLPQTYPGNTKGRWFRAASAKRWSVTIALITIALILAAVLLRLGTTNYNLQSEAQAFRLGFGKIDPRTIITLYGLPSQGAKGLLAAVLIANSPQTICSFLYLAYNGLFTCMLLSQEWSRYFLKVKPLRVTTPYGQQRSKYYLQLPFAYSAPLLGASVLLHWLISESIFLARVDYYHNGVKDSTSSEVGYSPLPILVALLLGFAMLGVLIGHGFRRFSSPMPVAGSCSVAIASACHRPKDDEDAAYLPVAWGEVNHEGTEEVGHCAFTSQQVYEPVKGRMYAGSHDRMEGNFVPTARKTQ